MSQQELYGFTRVTGTMLAKCLPKGHLWDWSQDFEKELLKKTRGTQNGAPSSLCLCFSPVLLLYCFFFYPDSILDYSPWGSNQSVLMIMRLPTHPKPKPSMSLPRHSASLLNLSVQISIPPTSLPARHLPVSSPWAALLSSPAPGMI